MNFDELLDEAYRGFATGANVELSELRLLYYGRKGIHIAFSDAGEYSFETTVHELDRPDGILCHPLNDVISRRVNSSEFYANVFRVGSGRTIEDIRRYTRDNFNVDLTKLQNMKLLDEDTFDELATPIIKDVRIRHYFQRLWDLTGDIAKEKGGENFGKVWRDILMRLGYTRIVDTSGTGIIVSGRRPVTMYLDYANRQDLDIVPIQKNRLDPRLHTRQSVERKIARMGVRRNRISRRRVETRGV